MKLKVILAVSLFSTGLAFGQFTYATNDTSILTISRGVIVDTRPLVSVPVNTNVAPASAATIVSTNGQVLPPAFVEQVSTTLGIPDFVVKMIPLKYIAWLALLAWLTPYAGRAWHAWQADGGAKDIMGAVVMGTNVPVAMKVQAAGAAVVPASTPDAAPATPPKT